MESMHQMNRSGFLDWVERVGNRLPHPATLFFLGALLVMALSQIAVIMGWSVDKVVAADGATGTKIEAVEAVGLLNADGTWWVASHLIDNFMSFPPLGLVLVAMLGIGVAERSGLIPALIIRIMESVPSTFLTPAVVLVGILSSVALDAGYIVLPPLAAALYAAVGRSPLAGLAAAFAGVSAGFSANFIITAVDPLLAGLTQAAAQVLDTDYRVAVTANWWFMIVSTVLLTLAGWFVTSRWVEPRLPSQQRGSAGTETEEATSGAVQRGDERRGLRAAGVAFSLTLLVVLLLILVPGAPLYGPGERFSRWVEAMVPLLLTLFLIPALAYGFGAKTLQTDKDVARLLGDTMASLGPYIVLAFFAAQFIEFFKYSRLGEMLAIVGGQALAAAALPPALLMTGFIVLVLLGNLLIGSASAKYAFLAPVFVPMFMQAGISPELTQAAYRVGDSVSNVITPFNPYMVIILAFMQRYTAQAGIGTLVSIMLPYTIVFIVVWSLLLVAWILSGIELGPAGPLFY